MTVEVQLQVVGLDIRDAEVQAVLDEHLSDYLWAELSGITIMTVFSDGNVVADVTKAARCAAHHGANVVRVYEDRVTYGDIARRVGDRSRETVNKWTQLDTFPDPRTVTPNERGTSRLWDWAEVVTWLKSAKHIDLDEELPTPEQVAEINAALAGVTDYKSENWLLRLQPPVEQSRMKVDVVYRQIKANLSPHLVGEVVYLPAEEDRHALGRRHPVSA